MDLDDGSLASVLENAGDVPSFLAKRIRDGEDFVMDEAMLAECETNLQATDEWIKEIAIRERNSRSELATMVSTTEDRLAQAKLDRAAYANKYEGYIAALKQNVEGLLESQDAFAEEKLLEISCTFAEKYWQAQQLIETKRFEDARDQLWNIFSDLSEMQYSSSEAYHHQQSDFCRLFEGIGNKATDLMANLRTDLETLISTELREYGWPMSAPSGNFRQDTVSDAVRVLLKLQMAALSLNKANEVGPSSSSIPASKSWAMDSILSPQIDRFRFHFRAVDSRTGQADHPEWPCNFVSDRLEESIDFIDSLVGPALQHGDIDTSLATSGAREFASALLSELARTLLMSVSRNDNSQSKRETRIAKILQVADATDRKIMPLVAKRLQLSSLTDFPSLLTLLAASEEFLEEWVAMQSESEEPRTTAIITELLKKATDRVLDAEEDELASHLGRCPPIVWNIIDKKLQLKFFQGFEIPTLRRIRETLQNTVELAWSESSDESLHRNCRVASLAFHISRSLQERGEEPEYLYLHYLDLDAEDEVSSDVDVAGVGSLFDLEAAEYESLLQSTLDSIREGIFSTTISGLKPYSNLLVFGDIQGPDEDEILAYDLTAELCDCLSTLESHFRTVSSGLTSPKLRGLIWRPLSEKFDDHVFGNLLMSLFLGGPLGTITPVQAKNDWLGDDYVGRAVQQVVYDLSIFVGLFQIFTSRPKDALWRTSEALSVLKMVPSNPVSLLPSDEGWTFSEQDEMTIRETTGASRLGTREIAELLVACHIATIC